MFAGAQITLVNIATKVEGVGSRWGDKRRKGEESEQYAEVKWACLARIIFLYFFLVMGDADAEETQMRKNATPTAAKALQGEPRVKGNKNK